MKNKIINQDLTFEYLNFKMIDNNSSSFVLELSSSDKLFKKEIKKSDCIYCPLLTDLLFDGTIKHQFNKNDKVSKYFIIDTNLKDSP